jgi:hypothetical protein
MKKYTKIL